MTIELLQKEGKLIRSWQEPDGTWYRSLFKIYRYNGKDYQVEHHVGLSISCSNEYTSIKEVHLEGPIPTHVGLLLFFSSQDGFTHIWKEAQGTPESLVEWATDELTRENYLRPKNLVFKTIPITL